MTASPKQTPDEGVRFTTFLESSPPNVWVDISDLTEIHANMGLVINTKAPYLHCDDESCDGPRFFGLESTVQRPLPTPKEMFLDYRCRNCMRTWKTFAIVVESGSGMTGKARKFGEIPPFGPPTSRRLMKLIEPDREMFLKGRRCETQGLGVGAFAYYRRVVEDQRTRIFDRIIEVAEGTGTPAAVMETLRTARAERQFLKSMVLAKDAIPDAIKLAGGHNPLTLLHGALSEGIHELSDQECLELATSVRLVLQDMAERAAEALKEQAELTAAVARLQNRNVAPE